jgi:RNA 3'-phosphate cyclase
LDWVTIDGSLGEGGGQVVRTSLALSAITGAPVRIHNIRARRPRPGLAAQHLTAVKAAQALCGARVSGARLGSTTLEFSPGPISGGTHSFAVGTAGAATLVLQVVVPIALHARVRTAVAVSGGTDVPWSPLADYFDGVFLAHLRRLGARVTFEIVRRGFYPKGGGELVLVTEPWAEQEAGGQIDLTSPGAIERLEVISVASQDLATARVAERQITGFERAADTAWGEARSQRLYARTPSTGTSIHARLVTDTTVLGVCVLGVRGKPAERVGAEAADLLHSEWSSGAAVDRWMADQIVPYLGLRRGTVRTSTVTSHSETNMHVVERFLPVRFGREEQAVLSSRSLSPGGRQ